MSNTENLKQLKISELKKTLKHFKYIDSGEFEGQFEFSPTRFDQRGAILIYKEETILSEHGFPIAPADLVHDDKMVELMKELFKIRGLKS